MNTFSLRGISHTGLLAESMNIEKAIENLRDVTESYTSDCCDARVVMSRCQECKEVVEHDCHAGPEDGCDCNKKDLAHDEIPTKKVDNPIVAQIPEAHKITEKQARFICLALMRYGYKGNKDSLRLLEENVDKGTAIAVINNLKNDRVDDAIKQLEHLGVPLN